LYSSSSRYLFLAASPGATNVATELARAVAILDDRVPIDVRTLTDRRLAGKVGERWVSQSIAALGVLGLLLASGGLFGIVAYVVALRTPEIGLRMALGGRPGRVLRLIWRQAMTPVAVGLVLGSAGATGLGLVIRSRMYGTDPVDPVSLVLAATLTMGVMSIASFIPARRATRISPGIVLKDT
jgi:ABC-type antimicrobial peptide transport system permease subunit